jgi:hypothetical protein
VGLFLFWENLGKVCYRICYRQKFFKMTKPVTYYITGF